MSLKPFAEGAGRSVGASVMNQILATPDGQAAVALAATTAIATAPVIAGAALVGGSIYIGVQAAKLIDKHF